MNRENHKVHIDTPDPGYEPYPVSIMNRSTREAMTFDPSSGKSATISYRLNKAGCIRVRIVHRNQPELLYRTLQDWTHQSFGRHDLNWDGRDASGNIVDNTKILVLFESKDRDNGVEHQGHDERVCCDPKLVITTEPDSLESVKGTLKLHTSFPDETKHAGNTEGVEVRYYVDGKLFKKERTEPGIRRYVCEIDTVGLENGEHLITVNTNDFRDHIGSAGVRIRVEN